MMFENRSSIDLNKTGMKLQWYARKFGYSVKDIQAYLRLSCPQPIYRWYKGQILPSVDNLLRLSELFCVHMEELIVKNRISDIEYSPAGELSFYNRIWQYYRIIMA